VDLPETLAQQVEARVIPGAQLGVLRDGETTIACAGSADLELGKTVQPSTAFQIASVTKPMNALAAVRLAARGAFGFQTTLDRAIPELDGVEWAREVAVDDLLTNTGGLPMSERTEFAFTADGDDALSLLATELAQGVPAFPARSAWSYSNAAATLLGRLIELVTGHTYEEALRRELFEPLEMKKTGFAHDQPPANMATGYRGGKTDPPEPATLWASRPLGPAGASVWSNVGDLLRLARPLVSPEEAFLEERWRRWLLDVRVELTIPPFMDAWCRSLSVFRWPGGPVWFWCGVCSGFRAFWLVVPAQNCALCLLVNSERGAELFRALIPGLLADLGVTMSPLNLTPMALPRDELAHYCGRYAWPDSEILVELDADGIRLSGAAAGRLLPIDQRLFRWPDGDPDFPFVTFADFGVDGRPHLLYHAIWAYPRA
jgi:CubicO group peptidase (beta-lactamase class C family)